MFETIKRNKIIVELSLIFLVSLLLKNSYHYTEEMTTLMFFSMTFIYFSYRYKSYQMEMKYQFELALIQVFQQILKEYKYDKSLEATKALVFLYSYATKAHGTLKAHKYLTYFVLSARAQEKDYFQSVILNYNANIESIANGLTETQRERFYKIKESVTLIVSDYMVTRTYFSKFLNMLYTRQYKKELKEFIKSSIELDLVSQ